LFFLFLSQSASLFVSIYFFSSNVIFLKILEEKNRSV
jgi:hypothetical protein